MLVQAPLKDQIGSVLIKTSNLDYNVLILVFDNKTFSAIQAVSDYESGADLEEVIIEYSDYPYLFIELGLLTSEEYEKMKYEKDNNEKAKELERKRKQYEALKIEFGE